MRHQFARKGPSSQSYGFPSSHVHMIWELDHKEGWVLRNWCFWTTVLQKTLPRVAWTAKRSNQSILKEIKSWIFTGRTDAEAEVWILWLPDAKSQLIGKDPFPGQDRTGSEGGNRGQDGWMTSPTQWTWVWPNFRRWWRKGKPGCCSPRGFKDSGMTEWLNNNKAMFVQETVWIKIAFDDFLDEQIYFTYIGRGQKCLLCLLENLNFRSIWWFKLPEFLFSKYLPESFNGLSHGQLVCNYALRD